MHIQTRAGANVSSVSLNAFWTSINPGGGTFDPRVHYDPYINRWILVTVAGAQATTSCILIAVSKTSNPTGAWWMFKITADGTGVNWLDYPDVGFNGKWITITGNLFSNAANAFNGAKVFVFNKANIVAGTSAPYTSFLQTNSFTICPAITYDPITANMFMVESWDGTATGGGQMQLWKISGAVGSETMTSVGFPASAGFNWQGQSNAVSGTAGADFVPQSGTANLIQANDDRITQVVFMNNKLWFAHNVFVPYSTTVNPKRCSAQWWQIDTFGNPIQLGLIDDTTATNPNFYFFPTVTPNTIDDAIIGFSTSSALMHPSAAYALHIHIDPVDSIRQPFIFRHGQNTYFKNFGSSRDRWGDYSGAALDPRNQIDFWTIQETSASAVNTWDTWWAHVKPCIPSDTIRGATTVCIGSVITLSDTSSGGVWSSVSTGVATITSGGVVTGVAAGASVISYTNSCGTAAATTTITVNPVPNIGSITGLVVVCAGLTTNLSDTASGGIWSSVSTGVATITAGGMVTGVTTGTSVISYTVTSSCGVVAAATTTVTVNAAVPGLITGNSTICFGGGTTTTTLSDAIAGGVWSSSNSAVATINSAGFVVTSASQGITTISYVNGCGGAATLVVTVNAVPAPIAGNSTICFGGGTTTTTLSDASTGGTWSSSNSVVATINSAGFVVTSASQGITTISYANGCGIAATQVITVNAVPAPIAGNSTICFGGGTTTTTLSDASTGGTWTSSNSAVATINSAGYVVTSASQGATTISYANGCGVAATKIVTVNTVPAPIAGNSTICFGGGTTTTTLSDASTGGTWSSSNSVVATINSAGFVVTSASQGITTISYANGCGIAATQVITVNAVPAPIAGNSTICFGGGTTTTTLSDASTGGTWTSSNSAVATINSAGYVVTSASQGATTISYANGCGVAATKIVTVNTVPALIAGNSTICFGGGTTTTTLSDASTGGTWSSSNSAVATINSAGFILTSASQGATVISYSNGCGSAVSITATVNATPAAITGNSAMCLGGSAITLSDASTNGTWSGGTSGIATVNSSTGLVTSGATQGTTTISYSNGCGIAASITATVNATSAVITGNTTICFGGGTITTTLSDAAAGGTWSSSNTAVATINSAGFVVTSVSQGTTTISYANNCGTSTQVVTVNAVPAIIAGNLAMCMSGSTITLSDASTNGTWSSSNSSVATISSTTGLMTPGTLQGTTTISYSNGCGSAASLTAIVNAPPAAIIGNNTICFGGGTTTTTLSDASTGGTWSSSNTAVATINSGGFVVTSASQGSTTIIYSNGCGSATTQVVTVNATPMAITGATTICSGLATTLSDATTGGTWSSGSSGIATVSSTGVVTGGIAGTATITYSNGCGTDATTTVTIESPLSPPTSITGAMTFCQGATIALSDATPGGVWSSGNTSIATVGPSGIVTGVSGGTAIISYSITNICGSVSVTSAMTVSSLPATAAITGYTTAFCAGTTIALSDATPGGTWSSYITSVATINSSGVVTGVSGGSSTIFYSVTNGCGTAPVSVIITVDPFAVIGPITGTTSVCAGSAVSLSDVTVGGTWSSSATGIATVGNTGVVTGIAIGITTLSYSISNSCGLGSATAIFTVNTIPAPGTITGIDSVCPGHTIALSDNVAGGIWSSDFPSIAMVTSAGVVHGFVAGNDTIRYSVTNSCGTALAKYGIYVRTVAQCATGIIRVGTGQLTDLKIFPNPNGGTFTITGIMNDPADDRVKIVITDIVGQTVYSKVAETHNGVLNERIILAGSLAGGTYLINVTSGQVHAVFHVVIDK